MDLCKYSYVPEEAIFQMVNKVSVVVRVGKRWILESKAVPNVLMLGVINV